MQNVVKSGQIAAIIGRFNSEKTENSEIVGWKFTKFGRYVAWLLPLNILKAYLWSANPLSNAEAKSKVVPCDADCTTSHVLNSGVTEPNLTKFLQDVQKWMQLLYWNENCDLPIHLKNVNVTNEDRRQIAGESRQKLRV